MCKDLKIANVFNVVQYHIALYCFMQTLFIIHFYYLNLYTAVIDAAITWIYYYFSCVVVNGGSSIK